MPYIDLTGTNGGWSSTPLATHPDLVAEDSSEFLAVIGADCNGCCASRCGDVNSLKSIKLASALLEWPASSGKFWQTTPDKQAIVSSRGLRATSVINGTGGTWDGNFLEYRDKDNTPYTFTLATDFVPFAVAFDDFCTGLAAVADGHKDALMAINNGAGTEAEKIALIEAYDITTGW